MKAFWALLSILVLASPLLAERQLIIYDTASKRVVRTFLHGGFSPPDYRGRGDVLFDPDLTALEGVVQMKYWKYRTGAIVEMTQPEKDAVDAEIAAQFTVQGST